MVLVTEKGSSLELQVGDLEGGWWRKNMSSLWAG